MRNIKYVAGIAILASAAAWAEPEYSASVDLGLRLSRSEEQSARFQEYRDLSDGVLSGMNLNYFNGTYHNALDIRNVGRDDQSYLLDGGKYHNFRYRLWWDHMPHNLSFGARTFYTNGVGTDTLSYAVAGAAGTTNPTALDRNILDFSKWQAHDYTLQRKDLGAQISASLDSPFFATLTANRLTIDGTRPTAVNSGLSSGAATSAFLAIEFPETVKDGTTVLDLETGYKSEKVFASVTGTLSKYKPDFNYMTFRNPFVNDTAGTLILDEKYSTNPDSDSKKLAIQSTFYKLPLDSTLQVRGSTERITNDVLLFDKLALANEDPTDPATLNHTLGLNDSTFNGDIRYHNASGVWSARPMSGLDVEGYYRFTQKKNISDDIIYYEDPTLNPAAAAENEHIGYRKSNAGFELGYKLPAQSKIRGGYEYVRVGRDDRRDATVSRDNGVFAELKNSYFDFLSAKVKYSYLRRTSDFGLADVAGTDPTQASYVLNFVRRFDNTDKRQNRVATVVNLTPMDDLDLSAGYSWKKNHYDQTLIGLRDDNSDEWTFDISYRLPEVFRVSVFADYEKARTRGFHRQFTATNASNPFGTIQNANSYNWEDVWQDKNYRYGIILQVPIIEETLDFETAYSQEKANTGVAFNVPGRETTLADINNFGDYERKGVNAKVNYKLMENLTATIGGLWERLRSDDIQYNGYVYNGVSGSNNGNNRFLFTGAYRDNQFSATTGYLTVSYKF